MLSQAGQVAAAEILGSDMRNSPSDRLLIMMPLFHIGAKIIQLAQHWRAGTVRVQKGFDAARHSRLPCAGKITVTHMAPTMIQALLDAPDIGSATLQSAHDRLRGSANAFACAQVRLEDIRTSIPATIRPDGGYRDDASCPPASARRDGPRPGDTHLRWTGFAARRMSASSTIRGRTSSPARVGEILLTSPGVMKGYWNNTAATIETLRDGWVHTGDVGRLDHEGYLYLVDRKKDMIISGGENVYSREVEEAVVTQMPSLKSPSSACPMPNGARP